jgi:hypothetical protein
MTKALFTVLPLALFSGLAAPAAAGPIRDNSFLIEEAYNQEAGVIQHISTFQRDHGGAGWISTFTQEWPVRGEKHQMSFTLPFSGSGDDEPRTSGVGDVLLNYRYQAFGGSAGRAAFAPRVSLRLPSGDETEGRGAGGEALELNLPLSVELSRRLVSHSNLGGSLTPSGRSPAGEDQRLTSFHAGQGLIWLAHEKVNFLLEALWRRETGADGTLVISPGVRGAIDLASGLQIVPGIAFPTTVGNEGGREERSVFLYLSFEHPLRGAGTPAHDGR